MKYRFPRQAVDSSSLGVFKAPDWSSEQPTCVEGALELDEPSNSNYSIQGNRPRDSSILGENKKGSLKHFNNAMNNSTIGNQ